MAMTTSVKKCEDCGSLKTNTATDEKWIKYQKWISDPYKEGKWICWKCYRIHLYLKANHPNYFRRSKLRKKRDWRLSKQ